MTENQPPAKWTKEWCWNCSLWIESVANKKYGYKMCPYCKEDKLSRIPFKAVEQLQSEAYSSLVSRLKWASQQGKTKFDEDAIVIPLVSWNFITREINTKKEIEEARADERNKRNEEVRQKLATFLVALGFTGDDNLFVKTIEEYIKELGLEQPVESDKVKE